MYPVIRTLNLNRFFVMSFSTYLIISAVYCSLYSKTACFIHLNGFHAPTLDTFFTYFTLLGDGLLPLSLAVLLLIRKRCLLGFHLLVSFLASGLVARLLKVLMHAPRPKTFLSSGQYHHFIEGVTNVGYASFPSGHTTTAFAMATILVLHTHNKWATLLYLILAIAVGYSRVYLGQHFPQDVLAGSIIGVFFGAGTYVFIPEIKLWGRRFARTQPANFTTLELP